ncbi:trafficking protein particle complex subunit 10 [Fomitopsis serialis]|uniref:trafficking protein particle complex subunit 10 n=1 Tax=Fomitopsis serialis TaxID=139415 RepID=UPI00200841B7|nr:trafficking protein particle complex subunit 10 [Neoantrodia serialis]KAH9934671.1 trafficking protein particle complex subunit 10 [Neoantrodia serialis]
MSNQGVLVTYASSREFLATDHWKQVWAALLCQFPLRTLVWRGPARQGSQSTQTIQDLNVRLATLESVRQENTSQIPQTLLEKPLLNIYFVVCEDNETYKNTVKKQIRDWHQIVSQRKYQEWLIVHIIRPEGRASQQRMFQMKTSVLDKIKADFNIDKKDRCVQLVWSSDFENPAAWAEFITKLKDGILAAFDSAFSQREAEMKRSEGQVQMPGWNFCTFFILKESLALSLEGVSLFEDALEQYNELETAFFKVVRDRNLSWFGSLISPDPQDDSAPLLSTTRKPYRDLIIGNTISIFDFRIYLLARQCILLSKLGRVAEICRRSVKFLTNFGRRLRELEDTLPEFFIESWIYSSALSVTDICDTWVGALNLSKASQARYFALKGELMELAQQQLDIIGTRTGHLPSRPPFLSALAEPISRNTQAQRSSQTISRQELLAAIADRDALFDLYVTITNRAIECYASSGRRKFAIKLHGNLAALDVVRGRLPSAFDTYKNLPAHYAPHGWSSLESFMRMQALSIHASTEQVKDADWAHIVLDFLKAYVEDMGADLLMDVDDHKAYVTGLIESLRHAADELQIDMLYPDHPALSVTISEHAARLAQDQDGALLDVTVRNRLSCDLPVDEIVAVLVGHEGVQLTFSVPVPSIQPGSTKLTLFCPSSTAGMFALQSSQVKMARLVFERKEAKLAAPTKTTRPKDLPALVRIPKDHHAVDVRLRPPKRIELGTPASMTVSLQTGRNDISAATLRLVSPSGVQFRFNEATLDDGGGSATLEIIDGAIILRDVGKRQVVTVAVPHSDASSYHTLRVNINIEYTTGAEPELNRRLNLARFVTTSLPVTTNVEDFFRGTRLFSRFTLSTTSHQHVRIRSAELKPSGQDLNSVKVVSCQSQKPAVVTVTPAQSGQFLFQLDTVRGKARDPLKLHITYRMLREEVESLINTAVAEIVTDDSSLLPHRELLIDRLVEALSKSVDWIELYGVTGQLVVPGNLGEGGELASTFAQLKQVGLALSIIRHAPPTYVQILGKPRSLDSSFGEWRDIIIPVDIPQMHILAAAQLRIFANPFSSQPSGQVLPLFAGQPISAVVTVTTSFHWAPAEDAEMDQYLLRYDIQDMTGDWLVSGPKRGDFRAEDGSMFSSPVTLIALHHGELSLPKVTVTALPLPGKQNMRTSVMPSCETYQLHGAERVMVLPRGGRTTYVVDMGTRREAIPA